jgi:uncharacterized protein
MEFMHREGALPSTYYRSEVRNNRQQQSDQRRTIDPARSPSYIRHTMANRLAAEESRYLGQHSENPVDWHPWGDDAFDRARRESKPLFVSIGYSSCHWCHVMAHESFEDPETASLINELFVPVKVDKEEFPDVDGYYLSFLTELSGSAGWPLHVLVNPGRAPFYGFTYLAPETLRSTLSWARSEYDRHDRIREQSISTAFSQKPVTREHATEKLREVRFPSPTSRTGPQFPQACYLSLALEAGNSDMVRKELAYLVTRGLFDHVEGGWFRYSVDPEWKVPHFEKMLYDQASLLSLCARAYRYEPQLASYAISRTIAWLSDHMRLPNGLYGSGTDADTPAGEGSYYTIEEIDSGFEAELFRLVECGRHGDSLIAWIDLDVYRKHPDRAEKVIASRRAERATRQPPELDTKAVFGWNALLGRSLYECSRATGDESIRVLADGIVDSLVRISERGIPHVIYESGAERGNRYLHDHAAFLLLLLSVPEPLDRIGRLVDRTMETITELFVADGKLWHTSRREFESQSLWQDTPVPSGGSMLLEAIALSGVSAPAIEPLLLTNIVDVAVNHPVFFSGWVKGYSDYLRDAR